MPAWKTSGGRESTGAWVSGLGGDRARSVGPTFFGLLGLEVGDFVVRSKGLEVVAALEVVEAGDELVGELGAGISCLRCVFGAGA